MTESIDVYYSRIGLPITAEKIVGRVYHKYLIYTDRAGQRHILRAGPERYGPSGDALGPPADPYEKSSFGRVQFLDRSFDEMSPEFRDHAKSLGEPFMTGEDLSDSWNRMRSAFHEIEAMGHQYWPQGVNSNTIIDATLELSRHKPTYRDGTAGNREWTAPDRAGMETISTPGYNHLPLPPEYYEERRKLQGTKKQRSDIHRPQDLLDLPEEEFTQATRGPRWRRFWQQ